MMPDAPIFYAEDDENDIFFLKHAFQTVGITNPMRVARTGQEAIQYLSRIGSLSDSSSFPPPCLIILDLKMPVINGMEVLSWLRRSSGLPAFPVIVFSSSPQARDVELALELGANAFVVKPHAMEQRIALALSIKEFWLRFNQPHPASMQPAE